MTIVGIITIVLSLVVTGLGLSSQVKKNAKGKSTAGLSFFYFFILAVSYSFWVIYGITLNDLVLIIPMSIGALMSWVVVLQFFLYRNQTQE